MWKVAPHKALLLLSIIDLIEREEDPDFEMMAYENMGEMYHCWDEQFKQDCIDYYLAHKEDN